MQITPAIIDAIYINFNTLYQAGYSAAQTWYAQVTTTVPSTARENRYGWMKLIPRLREWIGERKLNNLVARGYAIVNKDFEATIAVARNDIEDDQLGVFAPAVPMLGRQAALWPNDVTVAVIQAGLTTLCFDGQNFFSTAHPIDQDNVGLGTYSNNFTTTPLTAANYQVVRQAMMSYLGEDGKPLGIMPNLLVVPPQLEAIARQILNADFIAPAAAFGQNAAAQMQTNVLKGSANLLVIPELANQPLTWYLMDTAKGIMPFVWQLRKAPVFTSLTSPTDENMFYRKEYIYGVDARGNGGYTLPFLCARGIT